MKNRNEEFVRRLLARRPQERVTYEAQIETTRGVAFEGMAAPPDRELMLETIVRRERPVLLVKNDAIEAPDMGALGNEARELVEALQTAKDRIAPLLPLIGRIDVEHFPGLDFVGTGWFVDTDMVVTNRHVASLIARWDGRRFVFTRGVGASTITSSMCTAREYDDGDPDRARIFAIEEVLYIEPDHGPNDIAFVRVRRRPDSAKTYKIDIASTDIGVDQTVCVVGYPARAPRYLIPDQALMEALYHGRYDVKRAAPGLSMPAQSAIGTHDCTTLGGNSGSVVLDVATGRAVGLHFAGRYKEANYAVRASVLNDYVTRKRWNTPPEIETRPAATAVAPAAPSPSTNTVTTTIPVTITVTIGTPIGCAAATVAASPFDAGPIDVARVEAAAIAFYEARPAGVLAARVGFFDDGDRIGDRPFLAASVSPDRVAEFTAKGPAEFQGVPVRYLPAEVGEQVESQIVTEAVTSIAYDDDARKGADFSFKAVTEEMDVTLHVGPEFSWRVLKDFLEGATGEMVSGMYEFHAKHVKEAIEERLEAGVSLKLVVDDTTFSDVREREEEFDRVEVFEDWAERYGFQRIVAPEGSSGLIANAYHIKVTVRDDDTFWLSSGNWKMGSSQPPITDDQLANATDVDLPGNREWHVVIKNGTLAHRFRSHLLQDFKRSEELGAGTLPKRLMDEAFVLVPAYESVILERRPPARILEPMTISRNVKVKPLLTPDDEGAVYSKAVLELIESAQESLLFQIPYIGMPPTPHANRGFIDDLIRALVRKLKTLDDARVLLRSGGSGFSSPRHAAWYFKSKGVDIAERLRVIDNHHTKGMVVDGRRVLLGSHNWSAPGVTLNRDASLLFDDRDIAVYYGEAFEIDWQRANRVTPSRFVREAAFLEAVGQPVPAGYTRVPLSEWLSDG